MDTSYAGLQCELDAEAGAHSLDLGLALLRSAKARTVDTNLLLVVRGLDPEAAVLRSQRLGVGGRVPGHYSSGSWCWAIR
ncbi:MAG: hypothetical protein VX529_11810 [Pseudomonadota bacterium]|nr:hypothetical protein [Pseudomonadota bacterium]